MRTKTYEEINEKLARGQAVVLTAMEFKDLARELDPADLVREVDVVTTATFAPMCSSGVFLNFGHSDPPIRMEEIFLNGVPAYEGLAAVDAFLGATAEDPGNPGYGGAHVIEALVRGEDVRLSARGKGTDCYPRTSLDTSVSLDGINEAWLFNPRNGYQNYGAAVNGSPRPLRTYMGVLEPEYGSVSYSTSGELSPLLNDPECRTVGTGTPVFLCGARGRVVGPGTQYCDLREKGRSGLPLSGARTLALWADLKEAQGEFLAAARYDGYGISLFVGLGLPVPVLDEDLARRLSVRDGDIETEVRDYSRPGRPVAGRYTYAELRSGTVEIEGRRARTSSQSSLAKARRIAEVLKGRVLDGRFPLEAPREPLPEGRVQRSLSERSPGWTPGAVEPWTARPGIGPAGYRRSRCVDCGSCAAHCPAGALSIGAPDWTLRYEASLCDGCGACFPACPRAALGGGRTTAVPSRRSAALPAVLPAAVPAVASAVAPAVESATARAGRPVRVRA